MVGSTKDRKVIVSTFTEGQLEGFCGLIFTGHITYNGMLLTGRNILRTKIPIW